MGSFNAMCSITNTTLNCGDETTVQFMIPRRARGDSGNMFVKIFLDAVKTEGIEKAKEVWADATKSWGEELKGKGLDVSNDGAYAEYLPFGPAIKGIYDDYGNVEPLKTKENEKNIRILSGILHMPFENIMEIATDDRWYKLGMKKEDKKDWGVKGADKKTPSWLMEVYKLLTLTYIRTDVYDKLKSFEFGVEREMDKYDREEKKEYIDDLKKETKKYIEITETNSIKRRIKEMRIDMYKIGAPLRETVLHKEGIHACLLGGFVKTKKEGIKWYVEQSLFMYNLSGLCLKLQRSQYGSQHSNWHGFLDLMEGVKEKHIIRKAEIEKEEAE